MIKIRMLRTGKKNQAHFRIVAMESTRKRDGKYLELLGHYTPGTTNREVVILQEKMDLWIKNGAQMTDSVEGLLRTVKKDNEAAATPKAPPKKKTAKIKAVTK